MPLPLGRSGRGFRRGRILRAPYSHLNGVQKCLGVVEEVQEVVLWKRRQRAFRCVLWRMCRCSVSLVFSIGWGNVPMPNLYPAWERHFRDPVTAYLDMNGVIHGGLDGAVLNRRLRFIAFDVNTIASTSHESIVASPNLQTSYHEVVAAARIHGQPRGRVGADILQNHIVRMNNRNTWVCRGDVLVLALEVPRIGVSQSCARPPSDSSWRSSHRRWLR